MVNFLCLPVVAQRSEGHYRVPVIATLRGHLEHSFEIGLGMLLVVVAPILQIALLMVCVNCRHR